MDDTKQDFEGIPATRAGEPHKFVRDIIWVGIAQLFNSIIVGVGTMPAITKYYSADVYGIWTQINTTVTLLSPLIAMQFSLAVVRFLAGEDDKAKRRKVLGTMLSAITIASIVFLVAGLLLARQLSVILFNTPDYSVFAILTVIWVIVSAYFVFVISYLRARGKIRLLAVRQVIVSIFTLAIVIIMAMNKIGLEWIVISVIGIWIIFTFIFYIMVIREVGFPHPNFTGLKNFLAFSAPQMPGGVLLWFVNSSDRYFITHILGLSQTGIYTSSDTLGGLISLFYFPIQFVLFPMVSRLWEQKRIEGVKRYLEQSTRLFLTLAIPMAAGIALLSQPLLHILTTSQFLIGSEIVFFVACGTILFGIYQINVNIILLIKRTKVLPLIIGGAAIINVLMNILLIPRISLIGAAISNIASFFILATVVTIWARKQVGYGIDIKYLVKVAGATVIMSAFLYFFKAHGIWWLIAAAVAGTLIYLVSLFLLKGFSQRDKRLIKNILSGIIPRIH